jgi:hypothetical protein
MALQKGNTSSFLSPIEGLANPVAARQQQPPGVWAGNKHERQ